jgi:DNA-binding response OmpR family regulator
MDMRILIAEDDPAIAELIELTLDIHQYHTVTFHDGESALNAIVSQHFDLALLDIMLPKQNGYVLLEALKKKAIPALFISAKTGLKDKIQGLNLGAEDYITKPFEPLELLARVDTALRRVTQKKDTPSMLIGGVSIDLKKHQVSKDNHIIPLSPIEYKLLALFVNNQGRVFPRDELLDLVWGMEYYGGTRTVDIHIQKLRAKLDFHEYIRTVHKIGYQFDDAEV